MRRCFAWPGVVMLTALFVPRVEAATARPPSLSATPPPAEPSSIIQPAPHDNRPTPASIPQPTALTSFPPLAVAALLAIRKLRHRV